MTPFGKQGSTPSWQFYCPVMIQAVIMLKGWPHAEKMEPQKGGNIQQVDGDDEAGCSSSSISFI